MILQIYEGHNSVREEIFFYLDTGSSPGIIFSEQEGHYWSPMMKMSPVIVFNCFTSRSSAKNCFIVSNLVILSFGMVISHFMPFS